MDLVLVGALLIWFVVSVVSSVEAQAHSWYPTECCSDTDCAPIPIAETPKEENGGFTLLDGRHVDYKSLRMSPDQQWHLCELKQPETVRDRKILCLYAPLGGV